MADAISIHPVEDLEQARAAAELFDRVWGEQRVIGTPLLWAMASHGGQVLGAFQGDRIVGAQVGVIGLHDGRPTLHSHITGVLAEVQHHGVGYMLKTAQRDWCLERGIDRVTWTFDPMVARNAYFNLVKLGAVAIRFHREYYGDMQDAFNRGDRSDRLEVVWELDSERVRNALGPRERQESAKENVPGSFDVWHELVMNDDGRPVTHELNPAQEKVSIAVPEQYHALRAEDPERARAWRDAVGEALETALAHGYRVVSFVRKAGYVLERS
jgi:predicted GNAT superfamily acetyltransferase